MSGTFKLTHSASSSSRRTPPSLRSDTRGAAALFAAIMLCVLLFFTGLAVDLGLALLTKRRLQAATDMAAMAAAQNTASAHDATSAMLSANGFSVNNLTALTTGAYVANAKVLPANRYTAGVQPANAVSVSTAFPVPMHFISALVRNARLTVDAQAAAVQVTEAGIVAGSGLASVNGGLTNAMLGGLLGTQFTLDTVSYNGLANADVNALDFLNALAAQAHITTGTYGQLLTGSLTMGQVLNATIAALNSPGSIGSTQIEAIGALQEIDAQLNGSPSVALGTLFNAGLWNNARVGSMDPATALHSEVNVFQIVTFAAQIANGSHLVQAPASVNIPGVATVDVATTAIEPPQGSYFSVGPTGTTVHTSQVRAQLTIKLLNPLIVPPASSAAVTLPIYEEVASGTASVSAISCGASPAQDATVGVRAQSGLSTAYVGQVQPAAMTNTTQAVTVSPATIVNLAGIQVTGQAVVSAQGNTQNLVFDQQQISSLTPQTISSTNMSSNLLSTLQSTLVLQTQPVGIPAIPQLLTPLLTPAFAALDGVTDQILRTLGVRVGYLDVTVNGVRCGVPALFE